MRDYKFIQGILIGIMLWGAVSVGLRYIHTVWGEPIPHILLAPGRTMKPFLQDYKKEGWIASDKAIAPTPALTESLNNWEAIKELIGFLANIITIIVPIMSGIFSFALWRKERLRV